MVLFQIFGGKEQIRKEGFIGFSKKPLKQSKSEGGSGFKDFENINLALLAKLG